MTCPSAPTPPRHAHAAHPGGGTARAALLHQYALAWSNWTTASSRSALEAPTIRVNDAFTRGGAAGRRRPRTTLVNLASDLDYVRGIHSVRTGSCSTPAGTTRRHDELSWDVHVREPRRLRSRPPRTYTRRIGDPNIRYSTCRRAWYLQDDIRVRRGLTLSPGVRYEAQTHLDD